MANESTQALKRETVLAIFNKAIELNEDFKHSVKTLPLEAQQKKRKIVEEYHENQLTEALEECVNLLSSGSDVLLADRFFDVLLSFENSADETLSYVFGEIFLNNPDLIINTFKKFKKTEQKILYQRLEWGFKNITIQKKISEKVLKDRLEKMKQLNMETLETSYSPPVKRKLTSLQFQYDSCRALIKEVNFLKQKWDTVFEIKKRIDATNRYIDPNIREKIDRLKRSTAGG